MPSHAFYVWSAMMIFLSCGLFPHSTEALVFGVIGDWAMGGWKSSWYPEIRTALQFNEQCNFLKCNFTISVGDNVYCGNVGYCLEQSFVRGFKSGGPFMPSVGNHDNVGPQLSYTASNPRWKFPARFYTYKMPIDNTGYTVQVFSVNTMDGSLGGGGQFAWLSRELAKSNARWKIIFGHYPTVGSGRHRRVGTVGRIHHLMTAYNVQAYFAGHDHIVEMNNMGGRVLGISGGVSRGGMMRRGIGGPFRRFTLTSPGDYNRFAPDWPTHGFITVDLSPNVMNVNIFEANGGMYYDMSVTWDWLRRVRSQSQAQQNQWPKPSVVLEAYKNETRLPRGPGGGVVFLPDGRIVPSSIIDVSNQTSDGAQTKGDFAEDDQQASEEKSDDSDIMGEIEKAEDKNAAPSFVKYAVSSECVECNNEPVVDRPFTVVVQGVSVSSVTRMFLTSSALGCDVKEKPDLLPGTDVVTPSSNAVIFTVTGTATTAFVCFSMDKGSTYSRLNRADSIFESPDFAINPPPDGQTSLPIPQGPDSPQAEALPPPSPARALQATKDTGHSSLVLILVAFLCIGGGIVGGKYAGKMLGERQ